MDYKNTLFYRNNQSFHFNFTADSVSTEGGIVLSEIIERQSGLIGSFSSLLFDNRNSSYTKHSLTGMIKQRVFLMMQGYCDCNDTALLQNDPVVNTVLGQLASQPTLSRLENSISVWDIKKMIDHSIAKYVDTISVHRNRIVIDVDATDDPTHGHQQLSLFNGFYGEMMYSQLLFHDGETGQLILPVLRPGNSHSNRWFIYFLDKIVKKIRSKCPDIKIIVRADSGYSGGRFYNYACKNNIDFCVGMPKNERLALMTQLLENYVRENYADRGEKHQELIEFGYKAESWDCFLPCYAKVESTGLGMNIRFFCSNIPDKEAEELYYGFYVKRGDTSENRIKELKSMCFSDRLSCQKFNANFFRLFLSGLCYEMFRMIRELIKKTKYEEAKTWQVNNLRLFMLKVGTIIKVTKKRVFINFSKHYKCQDIFREIVNIKL